MSQAKLKVSTELHRELQARISAWKAEREQLLKAQDRIAELDELIAEAEAHAEPHFEVMEEARKIEEARAAEEEAAAKAAEAKAAKGKK